MLNLLIRLQKEKNSSHRQAPTAQATLKHTPLCPTEMQQLHVATPKKASENPNEKLVELLVFLLRLNIGSSFQPIFLKKFVLLQSNKNNMFSFGVSFRSFFPGFSGSPGPASSPWAASCGS